MYKIRNFLSQKLNIVRLMSVSIVIGVMMMLCFAVQIEEKKQDVDGKKKESKATGYDNVVTGANYCIVCDAETGKLYVTTKTTDETKEEGEDKESFIDLRGTSYYHPIDEVIVEARDKWDSNGNLVSGYTRLAELPDTLADAITVDLPDVEGELPTITVNSLYFSTDAEYSMVMDVEDIAIDIGGTQVEYDYLNFSNYDIEKSEVNTRGTYGDSDGRNGVRFGCGLYVYGDAKIEFEGESLFEINDPGRKNTEGVVVGNIGDIEACYGIYGYGKLSLEDNDNDARVGIEYDSLYFYETSCINYNFDSSTGVFTATSDYTGKTFANFDYGVFGRNEVNIDTDVSVSITRDKMGSLSDENQTVRVRGFCGIGSVGDVNIYGGDVLISSNQMVVAADSTYSYRAFCANPFLALPTDSFGHYKGIASQGDGDINVDKNAFVKIENKKKTESMYGLVTNNGDIINNGGKIKVYNEEAVRSYIYIDIGALTNGKLDLGVLREYETLAGIYGICVMDKDEKGDNKVIFNNGLYEFDSVIDKNSDGTDNLNDNGQSKYIWSIYGIYSYGDVEINNSDIYIKGCSESESVGIYSKDNQVIKNTDVSMHMRVGDTNWSKNGIASTLESSSIVDVKSVLKNKSGLSTYVDNEKFYYRCDGILVDNENAELSLSNCNLDIDVLCKRVYQYTSSTGVDLGFMNTKKYQQNKYYCKVAVKSERIINAININFESDAYKYILYDAKWDKETTTVNDVANVLQHEYKEYTDASDGAADPSQTYVPNSYNLEYVDLDTITKDTTPSSDDVYKWSKYISIKMKSFAKYHYVYNATNKAMYRSTDTSTPLESNAIENGWSIETINNKTYLVLKDFVFETGTNKVLEIVGDANVIVKGNNVLDAKCYQYTDSGGVNQSIDNTNYGIYVNSGATLTTSGDGIITVKKTSANSSSTTANNKFVPLYSKGALHLGPATHSFIGQDYGIESTSTVTLAGCNMDVSGATMAILAQSIIADDKYHETIVKKVNDTASNQKVSGVIWSSCKSVQVGGQVNYSLRYDATSGKMYKVSSDGTIATELKSKDNSTEKDMLVDYIPGWSVDANKRLLLEDFNFSTASNTGLEIVGDAKVVIDYSATNENDNDPSYIGGLKPYFDASSRTMYGIKINGNVEITSEDVMDIVRVANNAGTTPNAGTFVGIGIDKGAYDGKLIINGGVYNLTSSTQIPVLQAQGIATSGIDVGIEFISEGGAMSVESGTFAVDTTSHAMRYLTDTSKEPVDLKCGTSANFTLKGSKVSNTDNFRLHQTGEYRTVVASVTEGATTDDYPTPCDFTTCSYVKLGTWVNYYFVFDGINLRTAWKDDSGNEVLSDPFTAEQISNMGVEIKNNVLVLKTIEFDNTMADVCLKIVGETTGIKVYGDNVFKSRVYKRSALDSADLTKYGIVIESDEHTFDASSSGGTLTVDKASFMDRGGVDSDNDFIAVDVSSKTSDKVPTVKFNKGTFNFDGEEAAINVNTATKITVNKDTVTLIGDKYGIKNGGELTIDIDEDATANIDITAPTSISTNNVILDDAGYFKTAITEAVQSGQTITYPIAYDFTTYTSVKIGGVAAYYYRLNSDEGILKMCARNGSASKEVDLTKMDTLSIEEATTEDDRKYYVLVMENFNFETCADEAIQLAGRDNRPTKLVVKGENNINTLVYYNYPSSESNPQGSKDYTSIGVRLRSTDHIFEERIDDNGVGGTLNITKRQLGNKAELVTNGTFRSISSTYYSESSTRKSLEMKSGTYNLYGEGQAIYNEHTDVVISGGTYTITKEANANEAIKAVNKDVKFLGGTINVSAESGRAVYAKNNCIIDGATLNVSNSNIGVYTSSGSFTMNSGSLDISNSSTAMSIKNGCTITGGQIDLDDDSQGISIAGGDLTFKDGTLNIDIQHNAVNVQAGGLYMTGGTITCTRAEYALTSTTESVIAGGIVNLSNVGIGILVKDGFLDINSSTVDINATNNGIHFNAPNTSYVSDSIVNVTASGNALHYADTSETSNLVCDKNAVMNLNATGKVSNTNVALQETTDYKTAVVEATESGETKSYPSPYDLTQYTYAKIGTVNQFYLHFDGEKFIKVGSGPGARSYDVVSEEEIDGEWSYADGVLTLEDFNFATTAERCVTIGGNNNITVKLEGDNNFTSYVYYNVVTDTTDKAQFGLVTETPEITFTGNGTLNISKEKLGDSETMTTSGEYNGVVANNATTKFNVAGGILNVRGEKRGLAVNVGDLNVSGGQLNVSTSNAAIPDAHIMWIENGNMTVTGGKITTSTTMSGPIGLVLLGNTSKLTVTGGECIFRGPGQCGILLGEGGTLDIQVAVQGSRYYDGTEPEPINDINNTFKTMYSSYKYFRIMPAVTSVTIAWGALNYTGTEIWDAENLKYNCVFTTSEGEDKIDVINEGNMPVVARINYSSTPFTYKSFTHDILGGISSNIEPKEDDLHAYKIGIGQQLNSKLVIDPISYTGYSLKDVNTAIGDVTITLLDN